MAQLNKRARQKLKPGDTIRVIFVEPEEDYIVTEVEDDRSVIVTPAWNVLSDGSRKYKSHEFQAVWRDGEWLTSIEY